MVVVRLAFTAVVMALVVSLLVGGLPLAALVAVLVAVWLRRLVERRMPAAGVH